MWRKMVKEKYLGKLDLDNPDVKQRLGKGKNLTHISLFTGIGGFDIGFAKAGIKTRVMVEWDKSCCETLRCNFFWEELKKRTDGKGKFLWKDKKDFLKKVRKSRKSKKEFYKTSQYEAPEWYHEPEPVIIQKDIRETTTEEILKAGKLEIGECSIISGGFPCQGFSLAGERVRDDPRNFLYKEFVRVVNEAKPAIIIGENVPGIVSMGKGEVIQQICEDFANCGYDVTWDILNAADYGVPQHRLRVFLIGKRIDLMRFDGKNRSSLHIGAMPGKIRHPYLFYERIKRWKRKDFLKKLENNPQIEFMEKKNV